VSEGRTLPWIAGWGFAMAKGEPDFSPEEVLCKSAIPEGNSTPATLSEIGVTVKQSSIAAKANQVSSGGD